MTDGTHEIEASTELAGCSEFALIYADMPIKLAAYTYNNGYVGMGEVFVTILASSEAMAQLEAQRHFKEGAALYNQPEKYWKNISLSEVRHLETHPCVVAGSDDGV